MKKLFIAWPLAFGVMFGLAGLFNTVLIHDFVVANIKPELLRTPPNMMLILSGYVLLSLLMTLIYPRFVKTGAHSARRGLAYGMLFGIVWLLPYSLVLQGAYQFPIKALFFDTAWALLEQGAGGAIIGFIYAKLGKQYF
jgi:hypothetical protein